MKKVLKVGTVLGLSTVLLASCATKGDLENLKAEMEQKINAIDGKIERLSNLGGKVGVDQEARNQIQEVKSELSALKGKVDENSQKIDTVNAKVDELSQKIDTLSNNVNELLEKKYRK